ncbi:MAG: REP-associated tyrosine transposase [Terriglobia bacterium]
MFFVVVRLLRRREKFTEPDFALLARAFNRARALHPFYLTAWVFLPAHWHCICAPVHPVTISLALKSVKQSSMSAVNQCRGAEGELWQPRFFDRALRTVKEYNEKVEYIHLNPVRAGQPPGRLAMVKLQRIRRHERRRTKRTLRFDRRPRQNALRSARTNWIAPSRGRRDADHKSGGPRYACSRAGILSRDGEGRHEACPYDACTCTNTRSAVGPWLLWLVRAPPSAVSITGASTQPG